MNAAERRVEILRLLSSADGYINATKLSELFGVTRQIIVSDIALLRANGNSISSTQHGYTIDRSDKHGIEFTVVCKHTLDQVSDAFYAVVDNGGKVENVTVEHPLYGQISVELDIASRYDADDFMVRAREAKASQLSDLAGGVHVHTVWVKDNAAKERIVNRLNELGIIYNN